MKPYFLNDDNWGRMRASMDSWEGTPYRHLGMERGRGADCTLLCGAIWKEIGVLLEVVYDYYPRDWHEVTDDEMVLEGIHRHYDEHRSPDVEIKKFKKLDQSELIRGDLMAFNWPAKGIMISHHAAFWIGDEDGRRALMYNAVEARGVCITQYGKFWENRLTTVFRIMEK